MDYLRELLFGPDGAYLASVLDGFASLLSGPGEVLLRVFSGNVSDETYIVRMRDYALPVGIGLAMFGPFPASVLASNWNAHNPGLALGIANTPLLAALLPVIGMAVIRDSSLTTLYLLLAALHVALLPVLLGVSDSPGDRAHAADAHGHVAHAMVPSRVVLRTLMFWVMSLGGGFLAAVGIAGVSHLGPFAAERGIAPGETAVLLSVMGGAAVVGSLLVGILCSRLGATRTLALVAVLLGASWGILLATRAFPVMALATLLIGACGAGVFPAVNILAGRLFGQDSLPRVIGLYAIATLPITFLLPPGAGLLHDAAGDYGPVVAAFMAGCAAIAVAFALSRRVAERPIAAA